MRKILLLIPVLCFALLTHADDEYIPTANPDAIVQSGKARFTVLTPRMIRIEYSSSQTFEDRATFGIVNRYLPVPNYTTWEEGKYLYIQTDSLLLKYRMSSVISELRKDPDVLSITFEMNGKDVVWYPGKDDALNLKGTLRTLDNDIGDDFRDELENGLISRAGWAVMDESFSFERGDGSKSFAFENEVNGVEWVASRADESAVDWYFLGYGHDYMQALYDFTLVGGKQPMPPLYVFGYWYSKYQRYTQQEFIDIVNEIAENGIPQDVMIFDKDWHTDGWTGWTWDTSIIPAPASLIKWMHGKGLKVSLNLHPSDGVDSDEDNFEQLAKDMGLDPSTTTNVPWELEDSVFYKYMFKDIIHELEDNYNIDFWWIDWQQNLTNPRLEGLSETFWCNHVFYNDMKVNHTDVRPMIFHRWGGLGSHRYPIGFSGDTHATFGTLAFEPYFTATASNVLFGYWGHDLGGHQQYGDNDPELYLRWMQYGVFSPIFRTHATNSDNIERRIWKYSNFEDLLATVILRYTLIPYIYTAAREAYDTGLSMCRPLYYYYPEENNAYRYEDEYFFGNDILVAPVVTASPDGVTTTRRVWLPEGQWFDVCANELVDGDVEFVGSYSQTDIPYFYKAGSIIVNYSGVMNLTERPDLIVLKVVPGADGTASLYEDENDTEGYKEGLYTKTKYEQQRDASTITLTINARTGSFDGMPDSRDYTVEFLGELEPVSVSVNGTPTDDWTYDEDTNVVSVNLEDISCDAQTVITIERNTTAVKVVELTPSYLTYNDKSNVVSATVNGTYNNVRLSVVNTMGMEVASSVSTSGGSLSLSLGNVPNGAYICRLNMDGESIVRKIVKS